MPAPWLINQRQEDRLAYDILREIHEKMGLEFNESVYIAESVSEVDKGYRLAKKYHEIIHSDFYKDFTSKLESALNNI